MRNMKRGTSSNGGRRGLNQNSADISAISKITVDKIKHRRLSQATTVTYRDMTSEGYGWLLPGWVAEERRFQNGRLYTYYYDPEGHYYASQQKVLDALDRECALVVIDT